MDNIVKYPNEEAWSVASATVPGKRYKVTLEGCECKGFNHRRMCHHMDEVFMMLAGDKPEPEPTLTELLEKSIKATAKGKTKLRPEEEFNP